MLGIGLRLADDAFGVVVHFDDAVEVLAVIAVAVLRLSQMEGAGAGGVGGRRRGGCAWRGGWSGRCFGGCCGCGIGDAGPGAEEVDCTGVFGFGV